jgi:hypothetical protein
VKCVIFEFIFLPYKEVSNAIENYRYISSIECLCGVIHEILYSLIKHVMFINLLRLLILLTLNMACESFTCTGRYMTCIATGANYLFMIRQTRVCLISYNDDCTCVASRWLDGDNEFVCTNDNCQVVLILD